MLKRRRSRLVCAEKDLEWNGMECSGIRLKNFFLRLNPPLAVKVNRKHCVGSLGFSFLVSLGIVVEDFILWDVVNISHLNLISYKLICGLALILFSLFYRSMHDSFPRSLPRCCFPSLGLTWWRGSRMRRNIPWRSVSRLGRL